MSFVNRRFFRDYVLLGIGVVGFMVYFSLYPNLHPASLIDIDMSRDEVIDQSKNLLNQWNIGTDNKLFGSLETERTVIDSLQTEVGALGFNDEVGRGLNKRFPLFYWEVMNPIDQIKLAWSLDGKLVSFEASPDYLYEKMPSNRKALGYVSGFRSTPITPFQVDTLIDALLIFQQVDSPGKQRIWSENIVDNFLQVDEDGVPTDNNSEERIWKLIEYYLKNSYWAKTEFERDSVTFSEESNLRIATGHLTAKTPIMGMKPTIDVGILPAGSLQEMKINHGMNYKNEDNFHDVKEVLAYIILSILAVWVLVVFSMRVLAKAVDSKPALVTSLIGGFLVPILILENYFAPGGGSFLGVGPGNLLGVIFISGMISSLFVVMLFVITATSDSITRQYFPESLMSWDLLRGGIFKNKPVGLALLRAIGFTGIGTAIVALYLLFVPEAQLSGDIWLNSDHFAFFTVGNIIKSILITVVFVMIGFLFAANHLRTLIKTPWIVPVVSAIIYGAINLSSPVTFISSEHTFYLNILLGFSLGVVFIKYDFLTTTLTYLFFLSIESQETGWIVQNSPDMVPFIAFMGIFATLSAVGFYFVITGKEQETLPTYTPGYIEEQAKQARIRQELDIARAVQISFLPSRIPKFNFVEFSGMCKPAQDTGGDYYDIIELEEDKAAITIGDVSGKGIKAAFYMTFAKGVIHSLCNIMESPAKLLTQANRLFNEHATKGTFISMIYGVLDARHKTFTYVRAGHNFPLIKRANGEMEWLKPKGLALGMVKGDKFEECAEESTLHLRTGDVLVLYTDGITEAQNISGQFYGEERMEELLKHTADLDAKSILDVITRDVRTFVGNAKQSDDMTLVVIKA
ncbi:MAG: PP2C family protein-serine/threonine phosphatase [Bacteroidota bacterium]